MHKFWFWGTLIYAVTTLVYELQEEYIVYPTLTFVMQKKALLRWRELNTIYIYIYSVHGSTNFPEIQGPFKILGAVMLIWSQSHTDVPQLLDTTVKNLYASAPWRLGTVHPVRVCVCVCVCVCVAIC